MARVAFVPHEHPMGQGSTLLPHLSHPTPPHRPPRPPHRGRCHRRPAAGMATLPPQQFLHWLLHADALVRPGRGRGLIWRCGCGNSVPGAHLPSRSSPTSKYLSSQGSACSPKRHLSAEGRMRLPSIFLRIVTPPAPALCGSPPPR